MTSRLRILALSAELPFPPNHPIRLRSWHLLSRLARDHDVTVLTWVERDADADRRAMVRATFASVIELERVDVPNSALVRATRLARFVTGGLPAYVQHMFEERDIDRGTWRDAMVEHHEREPFDLIVCEEDALACLPLPDLGIPVVVHRLNVFTQVLADVRRHDWRGRAIGFFDRPAWRRFDRRVSASPALQVATTPESAEDLAVVTGPCPTVVITNGVVVPPIVAPPADGTGDVAFVGWMGYPANVDAVKWFARSVWPDVRRQIPATTFRIIGREPTADVRALAGPGVAVTGEVPDIVAACAGVRVGVAPLRAGMGIKNKTLELMAMGVPVVALPHAAEGIPATRADGLIVVDDAATFGREVAALLADVPGAADLGAAARSYVATHHSWDALAGHYAEALLALVGAGRWATRKVGQ
jgi:glycosyltransferase involved in cell wall biosynthesis